MLFPIRAHKLKFAFVVITVEAHVFYTICTLRQVCALLTSAFVIFLFYLFLNQHRRVLVSASFLRETNILRYVSTLTRVFCSKLRP